MTGIQRKMSVEEWMERERVPDKVREAIRSWGEKARHWRKRTYCNFASFNRLPEEVEVIMWTDWPMNGRYVYAWVHEVRDSSWELFSEKMICEERDKKAGKSKEKGE